MIELELKEVDTAEIAPLFQKWWAVYHKIKFYPDYLPSTAWVAFRGKRPMGITFCYQSNSKACQLAWTIVDEKTTKRERVEVVHFIIKAAKQKAKELGFGAIQSFSNNSTLSRIMVREGFMPMKHHDFLMAKI